LEDGIEVRSLTRDRYWNVLNGHIAELLTHVLIVAGLFLLYPLRLTAYSWIRTAPSIRFWRSIRVPATFDPAPLLYPTFLPVMVAISLLPAFPKATLPNVVLGLAALPFQVIPGSRNETFCVTHWLISVLPLFVSENTDIPSRVRVKKPYMLKSPPPEGLHPEIISSLFPLHQALIPVLHYLTTTSLLPAELHLLSISLINLLLFSESPHSIILETIIWVGGLGLIIFTAPVLRWAVALARVPRWRFRRAGRIIQARQSFIASLNQVLKRDRSASQQRVVESDADEDEVVTEKPTLTLQTLKQELLGSLQTKFFPAGEAATMSAVEPSTKISFPPTDKANGTIRQTKRRRYTLPAIPGLSAAPREPLQHRRSRAKSSVNHAFLSLTPQQASFRKWFYAGYVYAIMALLILGPIRSLISRNALNGHEPFGWALGYLFGNIRDARFFVVNWELASWIPLPPLHEDDYYEALKQLGRAERMRQLVLGGEANTRLWIAAYCLLVLAIGMFTVLRLSAVVEVDTRRKVFHGMMVAMLLPTTFVDPTFIALALSLILAIFLILDLLRASQLPPLSKPLAYFLTPYVDGRDLRGPVVVSHIFLLIGCAVPLWLSLASASSFGEEPWQDWEVRSRDVSMIAGVICVGMGDAAASLIGRRYGRRKWPWAGGKSLEGSAAFALAVTVGLTFGKIWLRLGQWDETDGKASSWLATVMKAWVSACGASFMEAVLTGGNDNVVVPIGLWLLVRGTGV
jgi:dolichol kinase